MPRAANRPMSPVAPMRTLWRMDSRNGDWSMRAGAFFAGTILAIGIFLAIAAVASLTPAWIGIGVLAISITAALSLVSVEGRTATSR
jgi:hypothetical protein